MKFTTDTLYKFYLIAILKKLGVHGSPNHISALNLELNWVKLELEENPSVCIPTNLENLAMYLCFDDSIEDRIWGPYVRRAFSADLTTRVN